MRMPSSRQLYEQPLTLHVKWGAGKYTSSASFKDVKDGAYYADAVKWAYENYVASGYSYDTFGVGADTTRGEAITFIFRALAG